MKRSLIGFTVATAALTLTALAFADDRKDEKADAEKSNVKAKVGKAAPDFELTDCYGKKHKLSDYKEKIVVLEWVNQQCPWCIRAIPVVKETHAKYKDNENVVFIGIESTHSRTNDQNKKYIKTKELPYTILMDTSGEVGHMYGAKTTPHIYVIDKGKLVYQGALHNDQFGRKDNEDVRNYLDETLAAILADKKVPVAETTPWGCSVKYAKNKDKHASKDKG
jgi:peroxiredoxin